MPATEPHLQCPVLLACAGRLNEADARVAALAAELDETQANWSPSDDVWSVAQCVDHLVRSGELYVPALDAAIDRARARGLVGSAPYRKGTLAGRLLVGSVDPRSARRLRAPRLFRPRGGGGPLPFGDVCRRLRELNDRLRELMAGAEGLDLARQRLASPASRLVRLSVAQAFEVLSLHELRHVAQAERLLESDAFPAATGRRAP